MPVRHVAPARTGRGIILARPAPPRAHAQRGSRLRRGQDASSLLLDSAGALGPDRDGNADSPPAVLRRSRRMRRWTGSVESWA